MPASGAASSKCPKRRKGDSFKAKLGNALLLGLPALLKIALDWIPRKQQK